MTEPLTCACGERYAVPDGWDAFACPRCRRVWRRDPDPELVWTCAPSSTVPEPAGRARAADGQRITPTPDR